ncbi:MAG: hydroxysqualene dehydroxylase HpnE [Pseudomonadota bacterium]
MAGGAVHVVGAGLSGLATAVRATRAGWTVHLYEATDHAGGRCRSFHDARLNRMIDNGNHLVLTGNTSVAAYLGEIDAKDGLKPAAEAALPFVDVETTKRWQVAMNDGPLPWWVFMPSRRVPETRPLDYLGGLGLARAGADDTVADVITGRGPLWRRFWEPMVIAVLNTVPERASAKLLWAVMRETFARGGGASRPMFAPEGLGTALIAPAVRWLEAADATLRFQAPLKGVEVEDGRAATLRFSDGDIAVGPEDRVVLALPPTRLRAVLPEVEAPDDIAAIVNAHFLLDDADDLKAAPPILGVLGSKTQWIFSREGVASLTISAAHDLGLAEVPSDELIPELWDETRRALGLPADATYAAARVLREKRATFDQSPAGVRRRPQPRTPLTNLLLAGDATDTGLPATIEGAVRSGHRAASLLNGN